MVCQHLSVILLDLELVLCQHLSVIMLDWGLVVCQHLSVILLDLGASGMSTHFCYSVRLGVLCLHLGGRGNFTVNYTGNQSFINRLSYLLSKTLSTFVEF